MKSVHIPSIPWDEQRSPTGRFHSFFRNVSVALGGIRNTGTWGGGHPFDVQIRRVPPGASICPFHSHLAQWELFMVLAGEAMVRAGGETHRATTGEVFIHPPAEPHQLTNSGVGDLEVLVVADNPPLDVCYYPDSDKWGMRPPGMSFRMVQTGYFDGEDDGPPTGPGSTFRLAPSPAALAIAPFATRQVHPDAMEWQSWESPKRKFRGSSKELSIALGAQRNTPIGLGGHPFDLELSKFEPGQTGVPLHSHTTQWELFLILRGHARIRSADGAHDFHAGDAILQPPGSPHQIRNGSESEDLLFLLIADNPPADIFFYPDTGKWGFRPGGKFFRMSEEPYWDGEESAGADS